MRHRIGALATLVLAAPLAAQQPPATPPPHLQGGPSTAAPSGAPQVPMVVYQLDLIPTGHALVIGKPRQIGDAYIVVTFPDRKTVKVPKSKVKNVFARTKDLNQEAVWQIDLLPSGRLIAGEEPVLKGKTYSVKKWQGGNLMSVRQSDVAKITRLTGLDAFKVEQEEKGASRIDNLAMEGTGDVTVIPGAEPVPAQEGAAPPDSQGNWSYQGAPGITDAYAPPSAVQASPGDVPKAAPAPTPQPR
jgi:hypothetical protein